MLGVINVRPQTTVIWSGLGANTMGNHMTTQNSINELFYIKDVWPLSVRSAALTGALHLC
jgi:hypothetical protein